MHDVGAGAVYRSDDAVADFVGILTRVPGPGILRPLESGRPNSIQVLRPPGLGCLDPPRPQD